MIMERRTSKTGHIQIPVVTVVRVKQQQANFLYPLSSLAKASLHSDNVPHFVSHVRLLCWSSGIFIFPVLVM